MLNKEEADKIISLIASEDDSSIEIACQILKKEDFTEGEFKSYFDFILKSNEIEVIYDEYCSSINISELEKYIESGSLFHGRKFYVENYVGKLPEYLLKIHSPIEISFINCDLQIKDEVNFFKKVYSIEFVNCKLDGIPKGLYIPKENPVTKLKSTYRNFTNFAIIDCKLEEEFSLSKHNVSISTNNLALRFSNITNLKFEEKIHYGFYGLYLENVNINQNDLYNICNNRNITLKNCNLGNIIFHKDFVKIFFKKSSSFRTIDISKNNIKISYETLKKIFERDDSDYYKSLKIIMDKSAALNFCVENTDSNFLIITKEFFKKPVKFKKYVRKREQYTHGILEM